MLGKKTDKFPSISIDNPDLTPGLDVISENINHNDEMLFWYSYDEDLKSFPNGIKVEKLKLTLRENILEKDEIKHDSVFSFIGTRDFSKASRKMTMENNEKDKSLSLKENKEEKSEFSSESSEDQTNI